VSAPTTQFGFLAPFAEVADAARRAEVFALPDPRTACFHARRALELIVNHLYDTDTAFVRPWESQLAALLAAPCFTQNVPAPIVAKTRIIRDLGNIAVHGKASRPIRQYDAVAAVRELFHIAYWFARTYSKTWPAQFEGVQWDESKLTKPTAPTPAAPAAKPEQLQKLEAELEAKDKALRERQEQIERTDAEIKRLQAEIAASKARAEKTPDSHDYTEAQTRDFFIDLLLREAGWGLKGWTDGVDAEVHVTGMPSTKSGSPGDGYCDYVLWGDDGKPLGVVEAKKTRRDARIGQQQAKLYADCLEKRHGQRPIIFATNGYEHWIWDDHFYPPRPVSGFYTKDELARLIARRTTQRDPQTQTINTDTVDRAYQTEAIREITGRFKKGFRSGLLVMATGTGKTRTVVALVELLQKAGWVKNTLFLADRIALVKQGIKAFKRHLPETSPVNLVLQPDETGRVYVSTYPTMMNLIEKERGEGGTRRFGPGFFDLIIIDEAHRSVYQKYGAIFEYFDAMLVGLTATPRTEIDRDTYRLFELPKDMPTFAYELDEAVKDGFLVPPKGFSVDLAFPQRGIVYDELTPEEQAEWDEIEWDEDNPTAKPRAVEPEAVNRWLFNTDTVDKVLEHLMTKGIKVAGGDRLAKTILFAKSKDHARFIEERFNKHYPHLKGKFARVIDHYEPYAHQLLDDFSAKESDPHVAISVDMLDTGVDVPEVCNLVFFKTVRSKTKFWQMIGRGTRLCENLFAPGDHKREFFIFDFCRNLEFFNQGLPGTEAGVQPTLGAMLFQKRLDIHMLTGPLAQNDPPTAALRTEIADLLHSQVSAMNVENFLVRRKRATVEKFADRKRWDELATDDYHLAGDDLSDLPSEMDLGEEPAKRFDLLMLRLQLTMLEHDPRFKKLKEQTQEIAGALTEKKDIPMVAAQMELILDIVQDDWWQNATLAMFENVRKRLRDLVQFIDKARRPLIYTDFIDTIGDTTAIDVGGLGAAIDLAQYKRRMLAFLEGSTNHIAIHKLRMGEPLTRKDLDELERLLFVTSGLGDKATFEKAFGAQPSLGLFVRSLIGLDREAAKKAFGEFLSDSNLTAAQIRFVNLVIDELTRSGVMAPERLFESPYTDASPAGLDGLFDSPKAERIIKVLDWVRAAADPTPPSTKRA